MTMYAKFRMYIESERLITRNNVNQIEAKSKILRKMNNFSPTTFMICFYV